MNPSGANPCASLDSDARVAQLVEHQLPKLRVAGSIPVSRSIQPTKYRNGRAPRSKVVLAGISMASRRLARDPGLALQKNRAVKTGQYRALTSRTARSQE